jgi:predicted DNA-binding protein with PD1-like motif
VVAAKRYDGAPEQFEGSSMQHKLVSRPGETRVWIAVLAEGEEVKQSLLKIAEQEKIEDASFVALGAFGNATIAYFDWERKKYRNIAVDEQVEVLTLVGDIVPDEKGKASLHAHTVLGRSDGSTRGGHLQKGHVRPTLEITITETPAHLTRRKHPELGIALIEAD